jgi:hypothetical protein
MALAPIVPYFKQYRGRKEDVRRKVDCFNATAQRIADYVNKLIANDPHELQVYSFGMIAIDLGVSVDVVHEAISDGGCNGITVRVTEEDRRSIAHLKNSPA